MNCIAHRGFAAVAPENTLGAVAFAESAGAPIVEVDVRRCGSGEIVVVHDERVDRLTGAAGRVRDFDADELAAMDVLDGEFGVPTLAAVFESVAGADLLLDVKEPGLVGDALSLAEDYGATVMISAFDRDVIREASDAGAPWIALLAAEGLPAARHRAVELGCDAIHPRLDATTRDFVETAREDGLAVNPWTVRSRRDALAVARSRPDGVISDAPGYCRWADRRAGP